MFDRKKASFNEYITMRLALSICKGLLTNLFYDFSTIHKLSKIESPRFECLLIKKCMHTTTSKFLFVFKYSRRNIEVGMEKNKGKSCP